MKSSENSNEAKRNFVEHKCALCPYATKLLSSYKQHLTVHSDEKPFKCPECPFTTKEKGNVKTHVKNVHLLKLASSSRPFPCPHSGCNYAAKEKSKLNVHLKIHSDKTPEFSCSHLTCKYSTNNKHDLIRHNRTHSGEKPWVCQFESCSYAAVKSSHLVVHSRTHTKEKPYKWHEPNCQYAASESSNLKRHLLNHHPKDGEDRPSFPCPLCEYSGKSKELLSAHVKAHTLEKCFKCDEPNCSFAAKTKTHIKSHKLSHSNEKPFVCSVESCEFRTKYKNSLSDHLKTHSEEKRYKCELCPFRGKTRAPVSAHIKSVHADPELPLFKCPEPKCGHTSKSQSRLKSHTLIHKGEKKYFCPFSGCDYKAITKYMVKGHHMNVHNTEKKFKCSTCAYAAKLKGHLVRHMTTHTKKNI